MEDVQKRIPYFIEDGYTQKWLHSSIGYCPPCEFETMIEFKLKPLSKHSDYIALICAV
jgi:hypothetical protein